MKKLLLLILTLTSLSNHFIAQQEIPTNTINTRDSHPLEWVSYFENDQIKIEYKFLNCDPSMGYDFEQVIFKFENKTSTKIDIDWHIHLYYNNKCATCDYPIEYSRTLRLIGNESKEGNCDRETIDELKLFSQFTDANYTKGSKLTGFQLASFILTTLE